MLPTYLLTYSDLERARELCPPRLTCFSIKCSMRSCISRFCKRWSRCQRQGPGAGRAAGTDTGQGLLQDRLLQWGGSFLTAMKRSPA